MSIAVGDRVRATRSIEGVVQMALDGAVSIRMDGQVVDTHLFPNAWSIEKIAKPYEEPALTWGMLVRSADPQNNEENWLYAPFDADEDDMPFYTRTGAWRKRSHLPEHIVTGYLSADGAFLPFEDES
jgi:hypothetical protein